MENKKSTLVTKIFYLSFIVIFLAFVVVVLLTIFKPFDYKELNQLKHTTVEKCLEENINAAGKQSKYYVLVYSSNDNENEQMFDAVIEYANFAKSHKDVNKIFVIEYSEAIKEALASKVTAIKAEEDLPYMFVVNEKAVSTKYDNVSKIANVLTEAVQDHEHTEDDGHNH